MFDPSGDPKPWADQAGATAFTGKDDYRLLPRNASWVAGSSWAPAGGGDGWRYGLHW